ncbi:MAG TPA: methyltransferase domain-containing protein [Terriglobia bacterium]|nr:methyltransferase domain-containing protein [Terriglobia bacterium]
MAYFEGSANYWNGVYSETGVFPLIYRNRCDTALQWIRDLRLPADARILEVGCGAGLMTTTLAGLGYTVEAMDSTSSMIGMTRRNALEKHVETNVRLYIGDAHSIPFDSDTFDLVTAIGVIPWLHSEEIALCEMRRILKKGGHMLVTADNRRRLSFMLDPLKNPTLKPVRKVVKRFLQTSSFWPADTNEFSSKRHYPDEVDRLINAAGFRKVRTSTVGFGPFTFFGKELFAQSTSVKVHRWLQTISNTPLLRCTGSHYLALARKC